MEITDVGPVPTDLDRLRVVGAGKHRAPGIEAEIRIAEVEVPVELPGELDVRGDGQEPPGADGERDKRDETGFSATDRQNDPNLPVTALTSVVVADGDEAVALRNPEAVVAFHVGHDRGEDVGHRSLLEGRPPMVAGQWAGRVLHPPGWTNSKLAWIVALRGARSAAARRRAPRRPAGGRAEGRRKGAVQHARCAPAAKDVTVARHKLSRRSDH